MPPPPSLAATALKPPNWVLSTTFAAARNRWSNRPYLTPPSAPVTSMRRTILLFTSAPFFGHILTADYHATTVYSTSKSPPITLEPPSRSRSALAQTRCLGVWSITRGRYGRVVAGAGRRHDTNLGGDAGRVCRGMPYVIPQERPLCPRKMVKQNVQCPIIKFKEKLIAAPLCRVQELGPLALPEEQLGKGAVVARFYQRVRHQ